MPSGSPRENAPGDVDWCDGISKQWPDIVCTSGWYWKEPRATVRLISPDGTIWKREVDIAKHNYLGDSVKYVEIEIGDDGPEMVEDRLFDPCDMLRQK